jgi:hypothetical protein
MLYAAGNAPRSPQKAANCIKNGKSFKEIRLSRYQSIDKKHFCVHVKFEAGLSILFTRKMSSKKSKTFSKVCPFFKLINEKLSLCPSPLRKSILNAVFPIFPCALPFS